METPSSSTPHEVSSMRQEYGEKELRRRDLDECPMAQFQQWFNHAVETDVHEPNAMTLSTISLTGFPTSRTVLLKYFNAEGFIFYTNYGSAKAKEIEANPKAALLFPWLTQQRQIRIEGTVEKISLAESIKYFASRPRESQLGAWVSDQSDVVDSRSLLLNKLSEMKEKFLGKEIPIPSFWGGYRVTPTAVEFWQGGKGRVHDRFRYTLQDGKWVIDRLAP